VDSKLNAIAEIAKVAFLLEPLKTEVSREVIDKIELFKVYDALKEEVVKLENAIIILGA